MTSGANKELELPIIARRTLIGNGGSVMIALPAEWLKQKGLEQGDKVILVANGNLSVYRDDPKIIHELSQKLNLNSFEINNDSTVPTPGTGK